VRSVLSGRFFHDDPKPQIAKRSDATGLAPPDT
jgi:hypothetical protein